MAERTFDGIVCFGGVDWWYHNRGHYDLQLMRELSEVVPVFYVNSLAMRVPRVGEGRMFLTRVSRKLGSMRRGLVRVRPGFAVLSPMSLPGNLGTRVSRAFVPGQLRRAAASLGIERPLAWVACPPAVRYLDALDPAGLVYQRTDRFEAFEGIDEAFIGAACDELARRADVTLYASHLLLEEEEGKAGGPLFLDHGVDFDVFAAAGASAGAADGPADVVSLPRPRVGFVGGIDSHTFDPELFLAVARSLDDVTFVMVGACSLPEGWCDLGNVHLLGRRPYDEVAGYMAACDVLIMPWNESEWVRACNPVKLKEYLAVGRPVVSTDFDELRFFEGFVRVEREAEGFARAIRDALADPGDADRRRERVRAETWGRKAHDLLAHLEGIGLVPVARVEARA